MFNFKNPLIFINDLSEIIEELSDISILDKKVILLFIISFLITKYLLNLEELFY